MQLLGDKIYNLRKAKGISQEALAENIGVSRQTIYKWETNTVKPTAENIYLLCRIFNVEKSYFYGDIKEHGLMETELAVTCNKDKNKRNFIIGIVVTTIIFIFSLIISFVFGLIVFSPNMDGVAYTGSDNIRIEHFILVICFSVVLFLLDIFLIYKLIKRRKSNKKQTDVNHL